MAAIKPIKALTITISSMRYVNHDMWTACDFKCFAPLNLATCSIQNIASSIGCTALSLNVLAMYLAFRLYDSAVVISVIAFENDSMVIWLWCNNCPFPDAIIRCAFRNWSPKNGIDSIGTPWWSDSIVPSSPPCEMNRTTFGWARISFCGIHFRTKTFDGQFGSDSSSYFHKIRCFRFLNVSAINVLVLSIVHNTIDHQKWILPKNTCISCVDSLELCRIEPKLK